MTTSLPYQPEFLEQKLDSSLVKTAPFPLSSSANEQASKPHEKDASALPRDRVTDKMNAEPSMSSHGKTNADSEDAKLKLIWDDMMKEFSVTGKPHRDTAVLLISWAEEFDDLHTEAEVNELERVFTDLFHYKVIKQQLSDSGNRSPYLQLSRYLLDLVDLVCDFDSDSTLLIVYYAGHGIPGEPGELHLAGNRQPDRELSICNAAAWHDAEHILKNAKPDVLLIFDCCYAGNLLPSHVHPHYPTRSFECIAACGKDKETTRPGENSFTTALIWSLKALEKDRKSFTTQELQAMIMKAPNFPEKQFVPLLQHDEPRDQRLVLAPLAMDSNTIPSEFAISTRTSKELPQDYLDLRFWYLNRPDEEEIKNLASQFVKLMKEGNISASRIGWLGLKERDREVTSNVVGKWRRNVAVGNAPVEPYMESKIAAPGSALCSSMPSESNTSKSTGSRRHLEPRDVSKADHAAAGSMSMSGQERIPREANINEAALLRGTQNTHLALGILVVAVLALSICACYASSLKCRFFFQIW